jgi:hypothetical protein
LRDHDSSRRKLLATLIPYLINAYWKARTNLAPSAVLSRALENYRETGQRAHLRQDLLRSLLGDIEDLNVVFERGAFSFVLDKETTLELIGLYLRRVFAKYGSYESAYTILAAASIQEPDAELKLPSKSIFVKLALTDVLPEAISQFMERAKTLSPSELWRLELRGDEDIQLGPVFTAENTVLFGRLRRLGLDRVLGELLGGDYVLDVKRHGDGMQVTFSNELQ